MRFVPAVGASRTSTRRLCVRRRALGTWPRRDRHRGRVRFVEARRVEVAGLDEMEYLVAERHGRLAQLATPPLELKEIVFLAVDALLQGDVVNRARGLAWNGVGGAGGALSHGARVAAGRSAPRRNE